MQSLLPLAILAGFILFAAYFGAKVDKKVKNKSVFEELKEKSCPPHKWRYEDQPGMENVSFIKCQRCLKTPSQINEGE